MKLYVLVDSENRIRASSKNRDLLDCVETDAPEDFDVSMQHHYRIEDGKLIHDPLPEAKATPDPIQQRLDEQETALMELAGLIAGGMS